VIYDGEDIEEWKERAAIMEFDGGLTREQAMMAAKSVIASGATNIREMRAAAAR
jgi:hypothetical protein